MITCPNCNKELSDGAKFCYNCGTKIFETIFCSNCGTKTSTEFAFCANCGASIAETSAEERANVIPTEKKKPQKKIIALGAVGATVVAVLILVISLFSGGGEKGNKYAVYLKDGEVFFTDLKKDSEEWQLTSRLVDNDDVGLSGATEYLAPFTYMSEDGKYIFFPDKIGEDEEGCNLYYKEVAKLDAQAIKIDSNVFSYTVNTSATIVTYVKGEEGSLYQYKIGEDSKEKIASDVAYYEISDDGKKIVYANCEGDIYLKYAGKEKEKIASEVSDIEYISENLTTVYYTKYDFLYKQVEGADKVKIASNVDYVIRVYDSGEIYYVTSEYNESDDWDEWDDWGGYSYALCFYNGKEEIVITDEFYDEEVCASDNPVIVYSTYNYQYDSEISADYEIYIAVKDVATVVEQEKEAINFRINSAGTEIYYIDDVPEGKKYGALYHIYIDNGVVGKAEVYDNDVSVYYSFFVDKTETEFEYAKEYKKGEGELYINKNKIDYDVILFSSEIRPDLGKVFYFTDWNNEKEYGTLKVYDGKESVKIADDVHSFSVTPDGRVLYLCDYSIKYGKGELREWYKNETRKLDDDVVFVIPIIDEKYRG